MEKIYEHCPSCAKTEKKLVAAETFKGQKYEISRCLNCDLVYTTYQSDDSNEYYGHSYEAWRKKYADIVDGKIKHDRDLNYLEEVSIIKELTKNHGRFLDVGCNAGWLLGYLQKHTNLELYGLEPSKLLSQIAQERLNIKIFNDYARPGVLPENFFDCISMTDVFEHIPNPNDVLSVLNTALRPCGHILIKVPNGRFTQFKYRLRYLFQPLLNQKDHFNAKEHLIHFDLKNLKLVLEKNDFQAKRVIVPKPIQTRGSSKISEIGRNVVYHLAKMNVLPAQDILIIAQKRELKGHA